MSPAIAYVGRTHLLEDGKMLEIKDELSEASIYSLPDTGYSVCIPVSSFRGVGACTRDGDTSLNETS